MIKKIVHNLPYISKLRKIIYTLVDERNKIIKKSNEIQLEYFKTKKLSFHEELQFLELKFGGYSTDVKPSINVIKTYKKSPLKHTGGDRFNIFYHDYSEIYVKHLTKLRTVSNILEIGILKGTGLAIWSEVFPKSTLFGFDWDLSNFEKNYEYLLEQGAFKSHKPNLFQYDQFKDNSNWLKENFSKISFDIIIDDAYHSDESIINSFEELIPYFSEEFIYIIEDNKTAWKKLETKYPKYKFDNYGEITVVTSR